MKQRIWRCACNHRAPVPVQALGETVTCPKCGAKSVVSMQNTAPMQDTAGHTGNPASAPAATGTYQTNCARCGRKFRGEWDIHTQEGGAVCNICARQATNIAAQAEQAANTAKDHSEIMDALQPGEAISKDDWNAMFGELSDRALPQEPEFRWRGHLKLAGAIVGSAGFAAAVIAYLIFAAPGSVDVYKDGNITALIAVVAELFVGGWIVNFVALYGVLSWFNELPNDTFGMNFIAIGLVALLLATLNCIGVNGFMGTMAFVLNLAIVKLLYDFSWREYFIFAIARTACGVLWALGSFGVTQLLQG